MNIDFMRWVDYYLGKPVCFVLSQLYKIEKFVTTQNHQKPIKKILFLQISEMGSSILAYSAMKKARELFPDAELHYFIFKEMSASVKLLDEIPEAHIHTITNKNFLAFGLSTIKELYKIRKLKIDAVVDLELFARISNILSYLMGSRYRSGFHRFNTEGMYRGTMQTHKVHYNPYIHIGLNFMSLVYALKQPMDQVPMTKVRLTEDMLHPKKIISTEEEKKVIWDKLKEINPEINENNRLIILNPNASELLPLRKWPLDNYKRLAQKLLEDENNYVIITGVPSEMNDAKAIEKFVDNKRCLNFVGKTSLRQLIDLYNVCNLMVTNDSGPGHFSTLSDMTTFVFFGPETPKLYKPIGENIRILYSDFACSPCVSAFNSRKSPCSDNKCLQALSVEYVYSKLKEEMKK